MNIIEQEKVRDLVEMAKSGKLEDALKLHWMWMKSGVLTYKGSREFILSLVAPPSV